MIGSARSPDLCMRHEDYPGSRSLSYFHEGDVSLVALGSMPPLFRPGFFHPPPLLIVVLGTGDKLDRVVALAVVESLQRKAARKA